MKFSRKAQTEIVETDEGNLVVHSLSCGERETYLDALQKNMKKNEDGTSQLRSLEGMTATLLCLTVKDENGRGFKQTEIQGWPSILTNHLMEISQRLSGLTNDSVEESKND